MLKFMASLNTMHRQLSPAGSTTVSRKLGRMDIPISRTIFPHSFRIRFRSSSWALGRVTVLGSASLLSRDGAWGLYRLGQGWLASVPGHVSRPRGRRDPFLHLAFQPFQPLQHRIHGLLHLGLRQPG